MLQGMDFKDMIDIATKLKKAAKPKSNDARSEYIEEWSNEIDTIVEALDAMKDAAEELRDAITDAGEAETLREFLDENIEQIRAQAETLIDTLNGVE